MKIAIISGVLFFILSCTTPPAATNILKFKVYSKNETNTSFNIKNYTSSGTNVQLEIKENDSFHYIYMLTENLGVKSCQLYRKHRQVNSKNDTIYNSITIEKNLVGDFSILYHTATGPYTVNGRYTSKVSSDFVEFQNYKFN